jgi:hypothetical protein
MKGSECRFRDAEVDQRVELINYGGKIIADGHVEATKPRQLARVSANPIVSRPFQSSTQAYAIAFRQRLYQRTTHAASRTGYSNIDHSWFPASLPRLYPDRSSTHQRYQRTSADTFAKVMGIGSTLTTLTR